MIGLDDDQGWELRSKQGKRGGGMLLFVDVNYCPLNLFYTLPFLLIIVNNQNLIQR